jgi:hypothetical protein
MGKEIALPIKTPIQTWIAQSYDSGTQISYRGIIYRSNAATNSTDVPGVSSKWLHLIFEQQNEVPYSLMIEDKVVKINGEIANTSSNYNVLEYPINGSRLIHAYVDLRNAVSANQQAIFSFWNNDTWVKDIVVSVSGQTIYEAIMETPSSGVNKLKLFAHSTRISSIMVTESARVFKSSTEGDLADISAKIVLPPTIYALNYENDTINILPRIYAEGIANEKLASLRINEGANIITDVVSTTNGTDAVSLTISANGYSDYISTINVRHSPVTVFQGETILPMIVGGSTIAEGAPSVSEFLFKSYNDDLGSISPIFVGTLRQDKTVSLGGKSFTNRACCEGRSGVAISDILRHAIPLRARYGSETSTYINGKAAWDSLGLGTMTRSGVPGRSYVTFSYNSSNGELMRSTCHGWYEADPTAELWHWIKNIRGVSSFVYNGTTYTFGSSYTSADNAAQKAYILYLCENPSNSPFFSLQKVNDTSGAYAFDFAGYINKYKTIQTNGTRLVVGSTAGTLVTNATDYDVCVPTHVAIVMSENDVNYVENGIVVANDHFLMASLIKAYSSDIKVAIGSNRGYGAWNPTIYNNVGFVNEATFNQRRFDTYKTMIAEFANNPTIDILPLYASQTVLGTNEGTAFDTLDIVQKVRYDGDILHAGYALGYLDRAYQFVAWIGSTL